MSTSQHKIHTPSTHHIFGTHPVSERIFGYQTMYPNRMSTYSSYILIHSHADQTLRPTYETKVKNTEVNHRYFELRNTIDGKTTLISSGDDWK